MSVAIRLYCIGYAELQGMSLMSIQTPPYGRMMSHTIPYALRYKTFSRLSNFKLAFPHIIRVRKLSEVRVCVFLLQDQKEGEKRETDFVLAVL